MIADVKLSEFPEIEDLLKILEKNGLFKQMDDVSTLVHYVEHMEEKLGEMSAELRDMHGEVSKIREGTIKAKCTQIMTKAQEKLTQVKHLNTIREYLRKYEALCRKQPTDMRIWVRVRINCQLRRRNTMRSRNP